MMEFDKLITDRYSVRKFLPVALLVMGKPAPDSMPIDMHYKKRPMDDVVRYENF